MLSQAKAFLDRPALGDRRAALLGAARWSRGRQGRRGRSAHAAGHPMPRTRALFATTAKLLGRVRATLRRASKRWTSSSRSALGDVPYRATTRVRSSIGRRRQNPLDRSVGGSEGAPVPRGTRNVDGAAVIGARLPRPLEGRGSQ